MKTSLKTKQTSQIFKSDAIKGYILSYWAGVFDANKLKKVVSQFWLHHGLTTIGWISVVLNLMFILFLFNSRNVFHVDELFSYGHANSTQGAWIVPGVTSPWVTSSFEKEIMYQWYPGRFFHNWLTVQPTETFHYKTIWGNVALDVHPPLHYALLHTVCSFTPNVFSKWQGAVINILLWMLLLWILFRLAKLFFKDSFYAWCSVWLYAYSEVGLDTVMFIRGYLLETLLAVYLVEQVTRILKDHQASGLQYLRIGVISTLGMLTHYNFLPFAALVGVVAGIVLCKDKEWQLCRRLGITLIASFALFIVLFPPAIDVIINSNRGRDALARYADNLLYNFLFEMDWKIVTGEYLTRFWRGTDHGWFFLYAGIMAILGYKYLKTKGDRFIDWLLCLTVLMLMYATFTMPSNMGVYGIRYRMLVYPLVALITVWYLLFFFKLLRYQSKEKWSKWIIGAIILINSCAAVSFTTKSPFTFHINSPIPLQRLVGKRIVVQGWGALFYWADVFSKNKAVYWLPEDASIEQMLIGLKSADLLLKIHYEDPFTNQFPGPVLQNSVSWKYQWNLGAWIAPYDEYVITK